MKRLLLAGLLVTTMALSRAVALAGHDDAYGSLLGMADSASSDRGPEAGEMPPDRPKDDQGRPVSVATETLTPIFESRAIVRSEVKPVAAAPRRQDRKDGDALAVAVPVASTPRVWTRIFAALLPSMAMPSSYEVAVSSAARRERPAPAYPATAASAAGSAQGLLELVAAATAPSAPAR